MQECTIVEKWTNIGLLEGLDDNKSELIANAYEIMLKYLITLENVHDLPQGITNISNITKNFIKN